MEQQLVQKNQFRSYIPVNLRPLSAALIDLECSFWLMHLRLFDCTFPTRSCCIFLELNDRGAWTAHNYIDKFEPFWKFEDNVERINEDEVSCEEFIERFEKVYKPVVIEASQVSTIRLEDSASVAESELIDIWHVFVTDPLESQWKMDLVAAGEEISKSEIQMRRGQRGLQRQNENEVLYRLHADDKGRQSFVHFR